MTVARLATNLRELSERVEALSQQVDQRFEQVDQRFEQVDQRFEQVDRRFEQVDRRFEQVDRRFDDLEERLTARMRALAEDIREDIKKYSEGWAALQAHVLRFEARNEEDHRLMRTQIDELDAKLRARPSHPS